MKIDKMLFKHFVKLTNLGKKGKISFLRKLKDSLKDKSFRTSRIKLYLEYLTHLHHKIYKVREHLSKIT